MGKAMENATVIVFSRPNSLTFYTSKGYLASKEYLSAKQHLIHLQNSIKASKNFDSALPK